MQNVHILGNFSHTKVGVMLSSSTTNRGCNYTCKVYRDPQVGHLSFLTWVSLQFLSFQFYKQHVIGFSFPPYRVPTGYSKLNVLEEIKAFPGFKFAFPKCYEFKKTGRKNGSLESVTLVLFKIIIKKQSEYYSYLCQC